MNTHRQRMYCLVIDLVKERLLVLGRGDDEVDEETNLIETGIVDSLAFLDLITALEAETGVELDLVDADPQVFTTIGGLSAAFALALGQRQNESYVESALPK